MSEPIEILKEVILYIISTIPRDTFFHILIFWKSVCTLQSVMSFVH